MSSNMSITHTRAHANITIIKIHLGKPHISVPEQQSGIKGIKMPFVVHNVCIGQIAFGYRADRNALKL